MNVPPRSPAGSAGTRWAIASQAVAAAVVALVIGLVWRHQPVGPTALALGLLLAAAWVAWRPVAIWWITLAALPVLDLAPWTGRLFVDEFDALLAVLIAVAWVRSPADTQPLDAQLKWALAAVAASVAIGCGRALLPWPAVDANAFTQLASPFNALRVARGAVWAWLLLLLARRQCAAGQPVPAAFGAGLVLGLLGTVIAVLAERAAFASWLDVAAPYRVAGPFSAMNIGGAYVECFLVVALPFLWARLTPEQPLALRLAGGVLLVGALYAVMVTFSRAGYGALVASAALMLGLAWRQRAGDSLGDRGSQALLVVLALAVTGPILLGPFAQSRLARVDQDLTTRELHWRHALSMIGRDVVPWSLGMGIGRYPALDLLHSPPDQRSASYRLIDGDGPRHLRLGAGRALYIEQMLTVRPNRRLELRLRLRGGGSGAALRLGLCEKWLVSSATCVHASVAAPSAPPEPGWTDVTLPLNSGAVGGHVPPRPVLLSLHAAGPMPVDLMSVQLFDAAGHPLLQNGDFTQGMDHWYFSSDHHLAWHTKSLPLGVLFDQGVLGVLSLGALLTLGLLRAGRRSWQGDRTARPWLLALAGFSIIGLVDTLIDAPRFLMLWLLLCGFAADPALHRPAQDPAKRHH